jgi:predicted metal-binding membrane protein
MATAALFLVAGLFQFSRLKYRCLDQCRSPMSFVTSRWHGRRERWQSFRIGIDHGVYCVGCCWALMLLMFAASAASVVWMLVLGAVMAIEKNMPWGRRLSAPVGVALLAAGAAMVLLPG